MGLDTRAYRKATPEWQEEWVKHTNAEGVRPRMWGLVIEKLDHEVTVEEAPEYYQDESLNELAWPGGLIGGMLSSDGAGPSFRGKCYDEYVEAVTGHSLYTACEEMWEGEVLLEITVMLKEAALGWRELHDTDEYVEAVQRVDAAQRVALAQWFDVCVQHDLVVGGDY